MSTQPYGTPPPPHDPGSREAGPAARATSGLAVVGLVLAVLVPLVGLVVSLVALGRTGPGKAGGRGLAVAGAIVGGALTFIGIGLITVIAAATDDGIDREVRVEAENAAGTQQEELPPSDAFVDASVEDWGALMRIPRPHA